MTVSRRSLLLSGAALGLLAPGLMGCNDQGVVVDNATGPGSSNGRRRRRNATNTAAQQRPAAGGDNSRPEQARVQVRVLAEVQPPPGR